MQVLNLKLIFSIILNDSALQAVMTDVVAKKLTQAGLTLISSENSEERPLLDLQIMYLELATCTPGLEPLTKTMRNENWPVVRHIGFLR